MERTKLNISSVAIEVFSVILAVSLALIGNDYRENINKEKLAKIAIANIKNEIKSNKALLAKSIEAHEKTIAYLNKFLATQVADTTQQEYFFERLEETAWETMKISQVSEHIDFQFTQKISKIYTEQKIYNELLIKMMDNMIFEGDYSTNELRTKTLKRHLVNFYILSEVEKNLMTVIDKFLTENEK